jgi:hypothetical protein
MLAIARWLLSRIAVSEAGHSSRLLAGENLKFPFLPL